MNPSKCATSGLSSLALYTRTRTFTLLAAYLLCYSALVYLALRLCYSGMFQWRCDKQLTTNPHTCVYRTRNVVTLAKRTAIAYAKDQLEPQNFDGMQYQSVSQTSGSLLVVNVGELEIFAKISITWFQPWFESSITNLCHTRGRPSPYESSSTVRTRIIRACARTLELSLLVRSSVPLLLICLREQVFWCVFRPSSRGGKFGLPVPGSWSNYSSSYCS